MELTPAVPVRVAASSPRFVGSDDDAVALERAAALNMSSKRFWCLFERGMNRDSDTDAKILFLSSGYPWTGLLFFLVPAASLARLWLLWTEALGELELLWGLASLRVWGQGALAVVLTRDRYSQHWDERGRRVGWTQSACLRNHIYTLSADDKASDLTRHRWLTQSGSGQAEALIRLGLGGQPEPALKRLERTQHIRCGSTRVRGETSHKKHNTVVD